MTQPAIPMLDLQAEVSEHFEELNGAIGRVLRSAMFIGGPEVAAFEDEIAAYLGVKHAVGCNSGSDALVIALQALGVGPGDEVLTTPFTFVATGSAALRVGATPRFCDIEDETFNLDLDRVEAMIGAKTRAVIPVHLYGHGVDMNRLRAMCEPRGIAVLEDVAQALSGEFDGRKLGTFGAISAYSFFPSKNLGAYGDGGLISTDDDSLAETARMLRAHGAKKKYFNEILGYNSRLDSIQAAILRVKLGKLDEATRGRQRVAAHYARGLESREDVVVPTVRPGFDHSFHQYTVRLPGTNRDAVAAYMKKHGVSTMVYYPKILPDLPLFDSHEESVPVARRCCREVLSLPIWPGMPPETTSRVCETLLAALDEVRDQ